MQASRTLDRTRHPGTAVVVGLVLCLMVTSCSGSGGDADSRTVTDGESTQRSPAEGGSPSPNPNAVRVKTFSFVPPDGLSRDESSKPGVALQLVEAAPPSGKEPANLLVFAQRGPLGSVGFRMGLIKGNIKVQLEDVHFHEVRKLEVPGATAARALVFTFTATGGIRYKQCEIVIGTKQRFEYGIRYGAPKERFDEEGYDRMVSTLRVHEADT